MSTIDSKEIIIELLNNNGIYPGDPQCYIIATYINLEGHRTYNVQYNEEGLDEALSSPFVREYRILWSKDFGLTKIGKEMLGGKYNAE